MADIRTILDDGDLETPPRADWRIAPPALEQGNDLETAVLISLFTDGRAAKDDRLPGRQSDPRGWWAGPIGSKFWLLIDEKATNETRLRAETYARDALKWLLDDKVADLIEVVGRYAPPPAEPGRLDLDIRIERDGRELLARRFDGLWRQLRFGPTIDMARIGS